jgi:hypothetical protein
MHFIFILETYWGTMRNEYYLDIYMYIQLVNRNSQNSSLSKILFTANSTQVCMQSLWECVQKVHRSGIRRVKKGPENLSRANLTSNTLLHSLIMFVTALYKVYAFVCYLNFLLNRKWSIYESLPVVLLDNKSSILREISACYRATKQSFSERLASFLLEALSVCYK